MALGKSSSYHARSKLLMARHDFTFGPNKYSNRMNYQYYPVREFPGTVIKLDHQLNVSLDSPEAVCTLISKRIRYHPRAGA